jgi:hypothetical protein
MNTTTFFMELFQDAFRFSFLRFPDIEAMCFANPVVFQIS